MDGSARMFAAPTEITLGGKKYRVNARIAKHYAEIEQHLLSMRPNPLKVARENLELFADYPVLQAELMKSALAEATKLRSVTRFELVEFLNSVPGTIFALWLALRDDEPGMTLEYVRTLFLAEIDAAVEKLSVTANAPLPPNVAEAMATKQVMDVVHDTINQATGEDDRGNSTGPSQTTK